MHENSKAFDQWLAVLPDGEELEGELRDTVPGRVSLGRDIKSVIFYSSTMKKGAAFVYPRVYKGAGRLECEMKEGKTKHFGTSISDMMAKVGNSKLYFRPEVKGMGYQVGDGFEYCIKVIPFSAEATGWRDKGRELATFDRSKQE